MRAQVILEMTSDWHLRKRQVMKDAVTAKFTQHDHLRELLIMTAPHRLVQLKPGDECWVSIQTNFTYSSSRELEAKRKVGTYLVNS